MLLFLDLSEVSSDLWRKLEYICVGEIVMKTWGERKVSVLARTLKMKVHYHSEFI